jgi:hypothetical protein
VLAVVARKLRMDFEIHAGNAPDRYRRYTGVF